MPQHNVGVKAGKVWGPGAVVRSRQQAPRNNQAICVWASQQYTGDKWGGGRQGVGVWGGPGARPQAGRS